MKKIICTAFFLFLFAQSVFATTYYVKNGGSDSASGTSDGNAWASLYKASTATSNGDTILLKRGDTWTVTVNRTSSCGVGVGLSFTGSGSSECTGSTPTANITVGAYGSGNKPIIDASSRTDDDPHKLTTEYAPVDLSGASGGFTIQDLDLRGPATGAVIQAYNAGNGNTIQRCDITGSGWDGGSGEATIQFSGSSHEVIDCDFDLTSPALYPMGVEFFGGSNHSVTGCTFVGHVSGGFARASNSWSGTFLMEGNYFEVVHGSCITGHNYTTVLRSQASSANVGIIRNNVYNLRGAPCSDVTALEEFYDATFSTYFYNNTVISDNDHAVINSYGTLYLNNNIFYDTAEICKQSGDNVSQAYNNIVYSVASNIDGSCGTVNESNTSTSNPDLVDPTFSTSGTASDADLTALSTNAIDGGTGTPGSDYYPSDDYSGDTRTGTIDIGAFEYGDGEDTTPPAVSGRNPDDGATGVLESTNIVAHVTDAGDGVDSGSISMTVEGSPVSTSISGTSADYTVTYYPAEDFSYEQEVNVTIDADDNNGNSMTTDEYSFTIRSEPDTTDPVCTITTPADNPHDNDTDSTADLAGTASDASGIASVGWTCPTCTPSSGSATGTTSWTISNITLAGGNNTFTVTATDDSENSNTGQDSVVISYSGPTPTATLSRTAGTGGSMNSGSSD